MSFSFQIFDEWDLFQVYCRLRSAFVPTMVYRGSDKPMLTYRAYKDYVNMAKLQAKTIFLMKFQRFTRAKYDGYFPLGYLRFWWVWAYAHPFSEPTVGLSSVKFPVGGRYWTIKLNLLFQWEYNVYIIYASSFDDLCHRFSTRHFHEAAIRPGTQSDPHSATSNQSEVVSSTVRWIANIEANEWLPASGKLPWNIPCRSIDSNCWAVLTGYTV